jgi:uncharacterized ParB-like nuclease family protein
VTNLTEQEREALKCATEDGGCDLHGLPDYCGHKELLAALCRRLMAENEWMRETVEAATAWRESDNTKTRNHLAARVDAIAALKQEKA